jgi:hypothetical protein
VRIISCFLLKRKTHNKQTHRNNGHVVVYNRLVVIYNRLVVDNYVVVAGTWNGVEAGGEAA